MRRLSTFLLMAGTLVLASCGGSDDDNSGAIGQTTSTAPAGVTRASYIAQADAFCKAANADAAGLNQRAQAATKNEPDAKKGLAALEPILKEGYAAQRTAFKALVAIPSPPADKAVLATLHKTEERQVVLLGRLVKAAESRDRDRFFAVVAQQQRVTQRARAIAQGYGSRRAAAAPGKALSKRQV